MAEKFGFFVDNRHYQVHREGKLVIVTFGGLKIDSFEYGAENTPLRQRAQWKIEENDPLEAVEVIDLNDMRRMRDADDA